MQRQLLSSLLVLAASAGWLAAQTPEERSPRELEGVGVDEHLGDKIDLNLQFTAEDGYQHALREYFGKGRPVLLNLVYYTCPMLCNLVLNAQTEAMRQIPWRPGNEYEVVTISIDPTENFGLARNKKATYLATFDRDAPGWHFLTDYQGNVRKLAQEVGFKYRYDASISQYAHPAVIFILSPEGSISRYLYGIKFKPLDIRLSLVEAGKERFSASIDRVLLFCYHYDPSTKGYTLFATNLMRAGGVITVLILGFVLFLLWRHERRLAAHRTLVNAK
jgi:protein SCO1/2